MSQLDAYKKLRQFEFTDEVVATNINAFLKSCRENVSERWPLSVNVNHFHIETYFETADSDILHYFYKERYMGFRPGLTHIGLYSHRSRLEA